MLNLIRLLLSIKVKFNELGEGETQIIYRGLTLIINQEDVIVLAKNDMFIASNRDLRLDTAKGYILIDSTRAAVEELKPEKQDVNKQESQSCSI
jgi:hypothetical protein